MNINEINPLTRFSSRANLYQNRAPYPQELFTHIKNTCDLSAEKDIADIGAGTGYLTQLLLQGGGKVFAVEPNVEMRKVAQENLGGNPNYISLSGKAEEIPLADCSVDVVAVGQALHWFDVEAARVEFLRVLRPGGWVVVVDMRSCDDASDLMRDCLEFRKIHFEDQGTASDPPLRVVQLFEGFELHKKMIPRPFECSEQVFCDGFLSSSLAPEPGTEEFLKAEEGIRGIFHRHQDGGLVKLSFETVAWIAVVEPR